MEVCTHPQVCLLPQVMEGYNHHLPAKQDKCFHRAMEVCNLHHLILEGCIPHDLALEGSILLSQAQATLAYTSQLY
jgi:hypothetical protein